MARRLKRKTRRPEPAAAQAAEASSARATAPGPFSAKTLLLALAIVGAGLWTYWPALRGGFLWDDVELVTGNLELRSVDGLEKIWFSAPDTDYWPLTWTALWTGWHLWGNEPLGYHLCSLALHLVSGFLIWRVLGRLGLRWGWLGGLLFVVHPLAVESVAWISEIKNTLSLPLFLLAFDAWLDAEENKPGAYPRSVLLYLAAMWSKTSTIMLPAVLLLYCWWKRGKITRQEWLRLVPYFAIALVLGFATIYFQQGKAAGVAIKTDSFEVRSLQAFAAVFFYFARFIVPIGFLPIYPHPSFDPPSLVRLLPIPCLLFVFILLWTQRRGWGRPVLFGLGFFLLGLLPVLGLVKMDFMSISWVSDHLAYLPMVGLVGLAVAGLERAFSVLPASIRPAGWAAVAAGWALLAWISRSEAALFLNEDTLWTYTLLHNPEAAVAHNNYGTGLIHEGRVSEAESEFEQALQLDPSNANAHVNLGAFLLRSGRIAEAGQQFAQAIALNSQYANAYNGLGVVDMQTGHYPEAIAEYEQALKISPDFANAHHNLATVLRHLGRVPEAIDHERLALKANPNFVEAHTGLGDALAQIGQLAEAADEYELALKSNPNFAPARNGLAKAQAGLAGAAPSN